ncbi:MAG: inositol monophosphatase family protein [Gemmatimonadaceae bacterium]
MPSQREGRALYEQLLDTAVRAARVGADFIRERSLDLSSLDWQLKSRADFVSEVDLGAETRISELLLQAFPAARVVGEELTPTAPAHAGISFVVDPLDGTTNFLHGYPAYAVSIGAMLGPTLVAAVVLDVTRNTTFTATLGGGTLRDGEPVRVSSTGDPSRALIGTGFPFKHPDLMEPYMPQLRRVIAETAGVRRAGSAALDLADVACGRFDGFWELMLAPWDIAAGSLLVQEAGGRVTDLSGSNLIPAHTPVVASNSILHDWLLSLITPPRLPVLPSSRLLI